MDRLGRLGGSAEIADDTFQESLARLSLHLATRRAPHALPEPSPPPRRFRVAWPYVLLVAIVAAGAAGYPYDRWLVQDDAPHVVVQRVAAAPPAPAPVLAAIAVAPEPSPPPAKAEPAAAAAIPAPPPPAPPVTLPAPADTAAPPAETALTWTEIAEVQKRLALLGIDIGRIDGIIGPRTIGGVQKYETRVGQAATGKVDRSLLILLRQAPEASAALQARAP